MTYTRTAAMRERLRIAALSRPRAHGQFVKIASGSAQATGNSLKPDARIKPEAGMKTPVSPAKAYGNRISRRISKAPRKTKLSRKTLVARVSTSVERELFAVEQLLRENGATPAQDAETERRARTLASLTRTLRELSQLQQAETKSKAHDDDAIPRDIDELRRELARRLDGLIADAKAVHPDLPGNAVDGTAD